MSFKSWKIPRHSSNVQMKCLCFMGKAPSIPAPVPASNPFEHFFIDASLSDWRSNMSILWVTLSVCVFVSDVGECHQLLDWPAALSWAFLPGGTRPLQSAERSTGQHTLWAPTSGAIYVSNTVGRCEKDILLIDVLINMWRIFWQTFGPFQSETLRITVSAGLFYSLL